MRMETEGKYGKFILWPWYLALLALGAAIIVAAISSQATENDPTGGAGFYAAMMALCVASFFLTHSTVNIRSSSPVDYAVNFVIGIGLFVGAYFWVSSESGVHPTDPQLSNAMLVLSIGVASIALLLIPLVFLIHQLWKNFTHNGNDLDEPSS